MFKKTVNIALLSTTFLLLLFILTGCSSIPSDPEFNNEAYQNTTGLSDEPPLTEEDMRLAVPDFLAEEQQLLYRRAHSLYQHMFSGGTAGIEYTEFMSNGEMDPSPDQTKQVGQYIYKKSQGIYMRWSDFDSAVHSIFTDRFWDEKNSIGDEEHTEIYREFDGSLYYIELERGAGYYYNENFPDEFILTDKSKDSISFTLIGHYTPVWPLEGETSEARDARRASSYDYTIEFPIKLVLTEDGWRFDDFHTSLGDERECESFELSACTPANHNSQTSEGSIVSTGFSDHGNTSTPEFFNDIGRTLSELKNEYPEGELIVKPDGFPGHAAVCFGIPKAEYLYYFFGTQSGDAEKAMNECEDRLQCAGFVTTASVLFPDMEADLPFEDFFSLIGVDGYEYFSGEDVITAQGWLRFTYHGVEVMVNTNEATTGGGWKFTGDEIVKRTAPASIVDLGILNTNQNLAEPVMFD